MRTAFVFAWILLSALVPTLGRNHVLSGKLLQCDCPVLECPAMTCDSKMVNDSSAIGTEEVTAMATAVTAVAPQGCAVCPEPQECEICQEPERRICPTDLDDEEYQPTVKNVGCTEWQYLCIAEFLTLFLMSVGMIVYCVLPNETVIRAVREEGERQRVLADRDERIKELEGQAVMMQLTLNEKNAAAATAAINNGGGDEDVRALLVAKEAEAAELAQQLAQAQAAERDADALIESLTSGNKKLAGEVADLTAQLKKARGGDDAATAALKRIADLEAQVRAL